MAGRTGLEPATSGSTVRSSNQLSYLPGRRKRPYNSKAPPAPQALFSESRILGDPAIPPHGFWGVGVVFFGGAIPGLPHGGVVDNFGSAAEPGWISRRPKVDQPPILKEAPARASEGKQERGTRARPQHNGRETTEAHGGGHGGARRWRGDNHNGHKGLNGERGRGPHRTGWTTRRNRRLRRLRQIWGSATADRTARGEDHGGHEGGWRTITTDTKDSKGGAGVARAGLDGRRGETADCAD